MRITHVTPVITGYGGVQRLLREVARRQSERGHEVQVLAIGSQVGHGTLDLGSVAVSYYPTTRRVAGRYSYPSGLLHRIRAEAKHPGIFHAHQPFATPTLLAAATRLPKAMTSYMHKQGGEAKITSARRALQLRLVAARYRGGLIFISESERETFEAIAGRRYPHSSVVPPGVSTHASTRVPYAKTGPVVLVVSRLVRHKQIARVIEALAASTAHSRLVVVGEGPERDALENACMSHGLDPSATLLGSLDDTSVQRWYQTADLVVSLSREESFGLTLVEAAVAGTPLLVSDIPAHRDALAIVGDHCLAATVPVDAPPDQVTAVLDRLLLDRHRSRPSERPARTWDDTVDELEIAYDRILFAHRREC